MEKLSAVLSKVHHRFVVCGVNARDLADFSIDPLTPAGLISKIRQISKLPIVGIGGINAQNYTQVRAAGAQGAAIISGILGAENIEDEVRKIKMTISD